MAPALHLIKLCVGADGPDDLSAWQRLRWGDGPAQHITRMWPTRSDDLLRDGSIYWVFRGVLMARQPLLDFQERIGPDGIRRCALILDPALVRTMPVPRRAFQGWRYLAGADAPADLPEGRADEPALPPKVAAALAEMGLI